MFQVSFALLCLLVALFSGVPKVHGAVCGTDECAISGDKCCNDTRTGFRCYNERTHVCAANNLGKLVLCGASDAACSNFCYDPTRYCCVNGALREKQFCTSSTGTTGTVTTGSTTGINVGRCTTSNCGQYQCCDDIVNGPMCIYQPELYDCATNEVGSNRLCGKGSGACGTACFDRSLYTCTNGRITEIQASATSGNGSTSGSPGSTTGSPGSTSGSPGSTTESPGSTTASPGSTTASPGSTTGSPASTTGSPATTTGSSNQNERCADKVYATYFINAFGTQKSTRAEASLPRDVVWSFGKTSTHGHGLLAVFLAPGVSPVPSQVTVELDWLAISDTAVITPTSCANSDYEHCNSTTDSFVCWPRGGFYDIRGCPCENCQLKTSTEIKFPATTFVLTNVTFPLTLSVTTPSPAAGWGYYSFTVNSICITW